MQKSIRLGLMLLATAVTLAMAGCSQKGFTSWKHIQNHELAEQLKRFVANKETLVNANTNPMPKECKQFFAAAKTGDWLTVSNIDANLRNQYETHYVDPSWHDLPWESMGEICGAFDAFSQGGEKYSMLYGNDIIQSIPPGSIYLTWRDPEYSIVAVMQKSQGRGDPFFTLSQADLNEYEYLYAMYGGKIYTPTYEDAKHCYNELSAEINSRMTNNRQDKPDYNSPEYIWAMDRMLSRVVFDKNTNREFYVEGISWGWMYPLLEPHGLIFKLNRQPLPALSDEMVQRDRDYWQHTTSSMIGDWLNDGTSITKIAAFAEKVFLRHDFSGFDGDPDFVQNTYTARMFSEDRVLIAELYAWRAQHTSDASEKQRMNHEADFAFRQAWALCPGTSGAVFGYAKFLLAQGRSSEAILVAETANHFHPDPGEKETLENLISQLKRSATNFQLNP